MVGHDADAGTDRPVPKQTDIHRKAWKYIYQKNAELLFRKDRIALADGAKNYTYAQMFRLWEQYAAVFTALHMTGKEHSRVGLSGSGSVESIIAFYGLNMVCAEVSFFSSFSELDPEKIIQAVNEEHLTDLILTDDYAAGSVIRTLLDRKDDLGLRNVILLHVPITGCAVPAPVSDFFRACCKSSRKAFAPYYMDSLLLKYENTPVQYTDTGSSELAVILHTTGTTGGSGHPIPLSDAALNAVCDAFPMDRYPVYKEDLVCGIMVDLHTSYGMADQVHLPLAHGGTVVAVPGGFVNPLYYKAVSKYKMTLLFSNAAMIETWMKLPAGTGFDFSSLKGVVLGGTSVSVKDKHRFYEFFRKNGCDDIPIINGYGVSEMGGVCTLSSDDLDDESIGYPVPGMEMRFFDEDTEQFHSIEDAPCTGVLYLHSDSMTGGVLDGRQIIEPETIDGKPFICTNDLVCADRTGKLTYLGRANRYFLHENGKKYRSGRVETEISRRPGIESCGIVPVMDKMSHDNYPMLCVKTAEDRPDAQETVRRALLDVFVTEKILPPENMPTQILLAEELPRNINGKIDLYRLSHSPVRGERYYVQPVGSGEQITDIQFSPYSESDDDLIRSGLKFVTKDLPSGTNINKNSSEEFTDPAQIMAMLGRLFGQ